MDEDEHVPDKEEDLKPRFHKTWMHSSNVGKDKVCFHPKRLLCIFLPVLFVFNLGFFSFQNALNVEAGDEQNMMDENEFDEDEDDEGNEQSSDWNLSKTETLPRLFMNTG